jgi:acetyl esterase/lipase
MGTEAFHPELRRIARFLPRAATGPRTLKLSKSLSKLSTRKLPAGVVEAPTGSTQVRLYGWTPDATPRPALLWIHGGGYVLGSPAQDDEVCSYLAAQVGISVASVRYRLAPQHPFPAGLDDCYEALTWLAHQPSVDEQRLAIGGASAGGGLGAALALMARDKAELAPAFQLLSYPMLDDRTALRTDIDQRNFRLWNNKANRFGWESYTAQPVGSPEISYLAAPGRCEDLSGLPATWLGVGTLDLFHDEVVSYADRLREAGVRCELEVVPGAFHGFDSVRPKTGVVRAFRASQADALRAALL